MHSRIKGIFRDYGKRNRRRIKRRLKDYYLATMIHRHQGNITATIIWFATTTGVAAGLSHYKEEE